MSLDKKIKKVVKKLVENKRHGGGIVPSVVRDFDIRLPYDRNATRFRVTICVGKVNE